VPMIGAPIGGLIRGNVLDSFAEILMCQLANVPMLGASIGGAK
jgi:hypothetical protein